MERILRNSETPEISDFSAPVLFYPIRHHSPVCSFQLVKTIEEYKLEENLDNFKKIEVNGDGNCLISSILTYLDIPLQYTKTLRNHIANAAEEYEWNNEILTSLNYQDNIDIAEKIKTPNTFIGYMEITPWLKKYKINLKLWLENIRYKSSPWLSINQNNSEETEQFKIYLSFKPRNKS